MAEFYYFGCVGQAGHYMWQPEADQPRTLEERRALSALTRSNPWGLDIDGKLCPKDGSARITYKDGWTALSFWDNTVDNRPGSNSNFLAPGTFTFKEMIELAKLHFPSVSARCRVNSLRSQAGAAPPTEEK